MKTYQEFLFENEIPDKKEAMTIEKLADICKNIGADISKKIGIPLGLIQQTIVMMQEPYPHIHCKFQELVNGLPENNTFLADECCQFCAKMAEEFGLIVHEVKPDEEHGEPGDIIAKAKID